jgi:hypothetical protein
MRWLILAGVFAGCGNPEDICREDPDCPSGFHCIAGTGLCERMRAPDASVPDLQLLDEGTD